ncbi:DUF4476 domain-containing protein [Halocola ammonii]
MKYLFSLILLFVLLLGTKNLSAQKAKLVVQSKDTLRFHLMIGGMQVNDSAQQKVSKVVEADDVLIDMILNDSLKTHVSTSVYLEENREVTYQLRKLRGEYRLLPFSEIEWEPTPADSAAIEETTVPTDSLSAVSDSTAVDSTMIYSGEKGCSLPASSREVRQVISAMQESFFERQKREMAIEFVQNNCVRTSALRTILEEISYEDKRLEVLSKANIYDLDNLDSLRDLFLLDSMKAEFDDFVDSTR